MPFTRPQREPPNAAPILRRALSKDMGPYTNDRPERHTQEVVEEGAQVATWCS